jgi:hypothetical protein
VSLSTQGIWCQYWGLRLLLGIGGFTTVYAPSSMVASGVVTSAIGATVSP